MPDEFEFEGGEAIRPSDPIREAYEAKRWKLFKFKLATVMGSIVSTAAVLQYKIGQGESTTELRIAAWSGLISVCLLAATSHTWDGVNDLVRDHGDQLARTQHPVQMPEEADILIDFFREQDNPPPEAQA